MPRWDRLVWDNVYRVIGFIKIPCNWLQCMENTPDPVHTEYLHGHYFKQWLEKNGITDKRSHKLADGLSTHFIKHDYTVGKYGIDRRWLLEGQSAEKDTWSKSLPLVFPDIHCTSGSGRHTFGWRMPIDDTNTMEVFVRGFDPGPGVEVPKQDPVPYVEIEMVDKDGKFTALNAVTGQDVMAWVSQGEIMDRTKERLGDTDRGIIMYRKMLFDQIARVEAGLDPINTFRDPAENVCIDLPMPWDRGYAWGYGKDGSYVPGFGDRRGPAAAAHHRRGRRSLPQSLDVPRARTRRQPPRRKVPMTSQLVKEAPAPTTFELAHRVARPRAHDGSARAHQRACGAPQSVRRGRRKRDARAHARRASLRYPRR